MDEEFGRAAVAIYAGDIDGLAALLIDDPGLATRASAVGHPTLLQLIACEAGDLPNPVDSARLLVETGAAIESPLVAAAGCNSAAVVEFLLDQGADIDGGGSWTPLDESLYWANRDIASALVECGATVRALSTAAGIGSISDLDTFFDSGRPSGRAGPIGSPFSDTVSDKVAHDPQSLLDHAFVMAVNNGQRPCAEALHARGARVNAKPPGYHWQGTALHAAAWRGDRVLVMWLLSVGADPSIADGLADSNAAGWATHHGHPELLPLFS